MALKGSTGTYGELLFAQNGAGAANTGTTAAGTATLISKQSAAYPLPSLDAGFFAPMLGPVKALFIRARGLISFASAATPQTLVVGAYFAASDSATIGTALAVSGTITPAASTAVTNAVWTLEADINCLTAGTSGTLQGFGRFEIAPPTLTLGTAPEQAVGLGGSAAVTYNTETAGFIQIAATWGASNTSVSNTLTCYQALLFAMN